MRQGKDGRGGGRGKPGRLRAKDGGGGGQEKERVSQTGTRTRVAWVKATYPNRLDYLGASTLMNTTLFTKPHKHTPLTPPHSPCSVHSQPIVRFLKLALLLSQRLESLNAIRQPQRVLTGLPGRFRPAWNGGGFTLQKM